MKTIKLFVFTICLLAGSVAQAGWFRTYGDSDYDEGRCVQEVEDGYIATGFSKSYDGGKAALWLLKTDTLGNIDWSKTYGATDSTEAVGNFVRQTQDGGYIIVGRLSGSIWLLKTNPNGDTVWTKTLGSYGGSCVQQTTDEGYIIVGQREWFPSRLILIKTNSLGDSIWARTFLLNGWVYSSGYFCQQTKDGGYIACGMIADTSYGQTRTAFWLIRTNTSGDTLWTYTQGGEEWGEYDGGVCVRETQSLEYISLANFGLLKFNTSGDTLWTRGYENGVHLQETYDDDYAFTGNASSTLTLETMSNPEEFWFWLFKTGNQGDSLWKQTYEDGWSYHIEETRDSGFIVTGLTSPNSGDLFLLKTDSLGLLGITENPIVETDNGWNVPHSIGSYVVLHYQGLPQGFRANVFDVSGRKVDQIRGDGIEGAMTWGINQPPGVYFIQALNNRGELKEVKVEIIR